MIADDSGVKHFDRKFVASNLLSLLRCPKCDNEFTYALNKTQGGESHRPFLLPCGHNLCESCMWHNRKDLKCAECNRPAPPMINAKDPDSRFGVNTRDFYELHYHVLGEASSIGFYRRFATDKINNSLSLSLHSDVLVQATMCSECGRAPAMGECRQCNAFYCRRCFDAVHKHSRVLKLHVFQKMCAEQPSKGLQVGDEVFALPNNAECKLHNMPRTIFCYTCKRSDCILCSKSRHQDHSKQPLTVINLRVAAEVPSTLSALDAALINIRNGQEVVRASKQKLSGFANETLANVAKRFWHLHGLLQVAELQVIEKLRESSLRPQMELNEAMGKLKGYETVIMRLKQMLESGSKSQMCVPEDILLRELMQLASEHVEKMPTTVLVSKLETNPYRFCYSPIDTFETKFKCDFVDPKIQVSFKTDFERDRSVSTSRSGADLTFLWSSDSGKENVQQLALMAPHRASTQNVKSTQLPAMSESQIRRAKKSANDQTSRNSPFENFKSKDSEFVRTFSALDISNRNVGTSSGTKSAAKTSEWFETDALVQVRSINSPEDFYVLGVQADQRLREELDTFAQTLPTSSSSISSKKILVGRPYITYIEDHKRFYRAMVYQKLTTQETYTVFLPDFGQFCNVHSNNFYELPDHLARMPYAAVHCSLNELVPRHGGSVWDDRAIQFLKQLVQNNPVHVIVKKTLATNMHEVDLVTSNYNTNISVRESFLYSGLARSRCDLVPSLGQTLQQQAAPSYAQLPRTSLQFGDVLMIQMLHVEHPQEFYVMRHDYEMIRVRQQMCLQNTMDSMSSNQLESIFLGRLNLACALLSSDGMWKRARIEQILPDGYVVVRLVDEGPKHKVFWDQLFVLPPPFWEAELAIKCCLADVETRPELDYMWTAAATMSFKQLSSNPKLHMEVIRSTGDVVHVSLNYPRSSGAETTSIGVVLVAQEHCTSSGESSRVVVNPSLSSRSPRLDADTRKFVEQQRAQAVKLEPFQLPENKDRDRRVVVNVLHVRQPDEFYVTLPHFQPAIEHLQKTVQTAASSMYKDQPVRTDWQVGEMCYVRVRAQSDLEVLWHRGLITKITPPNYQVQLRDWGELVEDVPSPCLTNIDKTNQRISNSAQRCHLHGIRPVGHGWSGDAIDFFKDQLQGYDHLHVTGYGCTNSSLSVIVWGSHTVISGPFSPGRTKFVSINKTLVMAGLAEENDHQDDDESMQDNASNRFAGSIKFSDSLPQQGWMAKGDKLVKVYKVHPRIPSTCERNEDMPPLELLEDLGKGKPTTGEKAPPVAWSTPRVCEKTIFAAIATNVNFDGNIFLGLASDKPYLEHMRLLLDRNYRPMMDQQQPEVERTNAQTYEVGQAVLVTFHMDNWLYRGIVQRMNTRDEYTVYYVDYGNMERVSAHEMLPYAPFPKLNAMCWLVAVHGVRPKRSEYSVKEMDTIHQQLVMKLSSVRIMKPKGATNGLPSCQIKVGSMDIATMMIDCDMAVEVEDIEDFKVFDELEDLAAGGRVEENSNQHKDETISTAHPPPAKKMYKVNEKEVDRFECDQDQDFDCKLAAQEMANNVSYFYSDSDGYAGECGEDESESSNDEDCEELLCSMDFAQEDDEADGEGNGEALSSPMEPCEVTAMDQLKRRIELRHKNMSYRARFSPMDTSTLRSFYDASKSFRTHILPAGVKHFQCTVDAVLSDTELQISPRLSEFTKHDISLVQETSALIKQAEPLKPKLGDHCLARYSKDKKWYRAAIKELHPSLLQATVLYIDFHDTETVSYGHLKAMPDQLFMFPLRSFRVKLYAMMRNQKFSEKTVRQALQACLRKFPELFARVHYPLNYHSSDEYNLIEVELFEDKHKKKVVYESLIDSWMLLQLKKE
ncbi:hypothetical protein KR009_005780 [Drosophila setifemur]|nr:hypothetical protein KR009_005780 [Drosophila setifemur]